MSMPFRVLAAVASCVLLILGCTATVDGRPESSSRAPSSSGAGPASSAPGTFADCGDKLPISSSATSALAVTCGTVQAPLDYGDPSGTRVPIAVIKIHVKADSAPIGSLIVNFGGPGAAGIPRLLGLLVQLNRVIPEHFDLVSFDPRGVGSSDALRCYSDAQFQAQLAASPDVTTAAGFIAAKSQARDFAAACTAKYGSALKQYNTVNTARDMDLVRQAVGDTHLNYLGFSYGTELGSVYAHLFPGRVRVAVLDGAVDPERSGLMQAAEQWQGFEDAFDQFAQSCVTQSPCEDLGDPRDAAIAIQDAARKQPLPTDDSRRPLTLALANTGIAEALYSQSEWTKLGDALLQAQDGNGSGLLALADQYAERDANGHYSNLLQASQIVECNDTPVGPSDAIIHSTARDWVRKYPIFGPPGTSGLFTCQQWQPDRTVPPKPTAPTSTKVLVVGNLNDPATPFQGAQDMTTDLGNAELLAWDGTGHTSYLAGSSCVDSAVNNYLIAQALPREGTTCPR